MSESNKMTCQSRVKAEVFGGDQWNCLEDIHDSKNDSISKNHHCWTMCFLLPSFPSSLQMQLLSDVRLTHFLGPSCDAEKHTGDLPEGIASKLPPKTQDLHRILRQLENSFFSITYKGYRKKCYQRLDLTNLVNWAAQTGTQCNRRGIPWDFSSGVPWYLLSVFCWTY